MNTQPEFSHPAARDRSGHQPTEEQFRRLAENMSDVVWTTDMSLKTTYISPSVERLVGETVEEHLHRTMEEKFPPDSLEKLSVIFLEEMEREKEPDCDRKRSRIIEVEHYRADGSTVWVSIHCSFLRDENGTPIGLQGIVRDIRERKAAEDSIRHSNDLMRYIIEHTNSAVAVFDRELHYIFVSQRYLDHYRVTEKNIIGKYHYDIFTDLPTKWRDVHQRALAGEVSSSERDLYPRANGMAEWVRWECRPWYEADGSIGGIVIYSEIITDRIQNEEALRKSEEYQRAIIAASPLAIISIDLDSRVQSWNAAAERIFGWKAEDVVGHSLPFISKDQLELSVMLRQRVRNGESLANLELTRMRKDGTPIEINLSTAPIHDRNGRLAALMGVLEDITERKAAEKKLNWNIRCNRLLSETAARLLQSDNLQSVIDHTCRQVMEFLNCEAFFNFLIDPHRNQLRLNACAGISDETRKQIEWLEPGVAVCGSVARDRRRMICENIRDTADSITDLVKSWGIQAYCCHPLMIQDRIIGTLSFGTVSRPLFAPEEIEMMESVTHLVAIAMNRIQVEEAMRESEEKFRLLVENSPDAIFVQTDGRFAYLNPAAIRLFGSPSAGELLGTDVMDRFHPDYHPEVRKRIRALNEKKERVSLLEQIYLRMDGSQVNVEASAVPFRYQGKDGAIVFVRDTSERVQRQKANEQLQKQLLQAQKMESVGRLAGGVAHDYNNMLSVILGYSELLQKMTDLPAGARSAILEIQDAAQRSASITRQLLAFARQQAIAPKILDLNDTVSGMLKMLQRLIGEDVNLVWMPGPSLWPVKVDPSQVDQILANLCVNARDAIDGIGKVVMQTHNIRIDPSYCADHPGFEPGDYVRLTVRDNGAGMDPETIPNIFEPFFTTKREGQGTGLGLATVYGIVRQNKGSIHVHSEPGRGTTFQIFLPRETGVKSGNRIEWMPELPRGRGETVLIVEDEAPILKLGKYMLESLGYVVLTSNSPESALNLAKQRDCRIDLLITDLVMPNMSGWELSEKMLHRCPDIRILYMSGYTASVIANRGVLHDGLNFIAKPFRIFDLAVKLREILDK